MQKTILRPALGVVASLFLGLGFAHAQDGKPASAISEAPAGTGLFDVNTAVYDDVFGGANTDGIFGTWEQQVFKFSVQFESETVIWGKKVAQQSFIPRIEWLSPTFGGESYLTLAGITPLDRNFADQFWITTGWKYRLLPWLDIDIGGNTVLFTRRVYGPGIVATNFGHRYRNDVYLGMITRLPLEPSFYVSYDTELRQWIFQGGLNYSVPIGTWMSVDGLTIDLEARGAYLNAHKWLGTSLPLTGANWGNSYFYGEVKADVVYRFADGFKANAGVRFSGNTDGTGNNGFAGLNLGPDKMVWFGCGLEYEF